MLFKIAGRLSNVVLEVSSVERMKVHIAAVFASNFSNHFIVLAMDYLRKNKLPDTLLDALIKETTLKAIEMKGNNSQTGPAVREDMKIIRKHQELLKNDPTLQKIYTFVSESIIRFKKEKESN